MNVIKSPQDNIEAYLYNEINIQLYKEHTGGKTELLNFFNLLFKEFEFFCENNNNYLTIENHFKIRSDYSLEIGSQIISDMSEVIDNNWHYYNLVKLIGDKYPKQKREGVLRKTCEHIEDVYRKTVGFMDIIVGQGSTFNSLLESISDLDNNEKINKLLEVKYTHLRAPHLYYEEKLMPFNELCDLEIQKINELIKNSSNKTTQQQAQQPQQAETTQKTPYKIALLNELGFFKLDAIKKLTKENQYKIISAITGGTVRTIKGNVLVLNPDSNENRITYTSNNHIDEVKNYLDKLK